MGNLDLWYTRVDVEELFAELQRSVSGKERKRAERNLAKARSKDSLKAFAKLTEVVDGEPRIVADPPVVTPIEDVVGEERVHELEEFLRGVIRSYRRTLTGDRRRLLERYRYVHAARKVVGVGSVGTRAYIMLLLGRDGDDPLFLQFKEAEASVLEPFVGKSEFANHGQRVVEGQRLTQAASDIMLGWIRLEGLDSVKRDFYVRQLWDAKGSALIELMEPTLMRVYAQHLRLRACTRARSFRRRDRDRQLPGHQRRLRPGASPCSPSRTRTRTSATTRRSPRPSATGGSKPKPASKSSSRGGGRHDLGD